jgi:hypothetical protein
MVVPELFRHSLTHSCSAQQLIDGSTYNIKSVFYKKLRKCVIHLSEDILSASYPEREIAGKGYKKVGVSFVLSFPHRQVPTEFNKGKNF